MEALLDLYEEPDDPQRPRVCFDERPGQLLGASRAPLPMVKGHSARFDYEDPRPGTCNLFIMVEPFRGWRHSAVTTRRTTRECAPCMRELVAVHCPKAEQIRVVLDNLSTHTPGALYEVLPPAEARRMLRRLAFHLTPVHGSWSKRAAIALAVLARQCVHRRIPDSATMTPAVMAWQARRNRHQTCVEWQFTTEDARIKLKSLDPKGLP
jgi:hypothetical protein